MKDIDQFNKSITKSNRIDEDYQPVDHVGVLRTKELIRKSRFDLVTSNLMNSNIDWKKFWMITSIVVEIRMEHSKNSGLLKTIQSSILYRFIFSKCDDIENPGIKPLKMSYGLSKMNLNRK